MSLQGEIGGGGVHVRAHYTALDDDPDIALVLLDLALPGTRGLDFLADLQLDSVTVASGLIHDVVEDTAVTVEDV